MATAIELNREWFNRAVPYFQLVAVTLSLVLPVAASATQFVLDDATYNGIKEELDLGQKSLDFAMKGSNIERREFLWVHSNFVDDYYSFGQKA